MPTSICQWITSFLTDRQQEMRLRKYSSSTCTISTLMAVFSPYCSSPCIPTTAHLKTPLSSSWSLQTTPHWSASSRTVMSLLADSRLRSWLSGAVLTTWSLACSKLWRWSWTSGETLLLSPTHHHEQHCDCSGPQRTMEGSPDFWANIGTPLPTLQELYLSRLSKRAGKITLDPSHPAHSLFELLPSGRSYRALSTRTTRQRYSFFPQAIHLMNTSE